MSLTAVQLTPDQRFNIDKLAGTRLAEIIDTYLSLDKDYAEHHLIDTTNKLTSQDAVYGQLTSILEFMQQIQQDGQAQITNTILANRNYLQAVYGEFQQILAHALPQLLRQSLTDHLKYITHSNSNILNTSGANTNRSNTLSYSDQSQKPQTLLPLANSQKR